MKYIVKGGNVLSGEVNISGAKNSVLPILASTILMPKCEINNIPKLSDVKHTEDILEHIEYSNEIPKNLSVKMRSSILFAGAMLSERGEVKIHYPGGCQIGKRPVDIHIDSLRQMGAEIKINNNIINAKAKKLVGANIRLPCVSVGATENIIIAAAKAQGVTTIENAAIEPEIIDLINFLNKCGANISFKNRKILIKGVKELHSCQHSIMADRIEAITYMSMAAITGGELFINNISLNNIYSVSELLKGMGVVIKECGNGIYIEAPKSLKAVSHFKTSPYPGIPTDVQPQLSSLLCCSKGSCLVEEKVFSNRIAHCYELVKMGADIDVISNNKYIVKGVDSINPALVYAYDLRGGAALVVAALKAEGTTVIDNIEHIKRGYENMIEKICNIGGEIEEV